MNAHSDRAAERSSSDSPRSEGGRKAAHPALCLAATLRQEVEVLQGLSPVAYGARGNGGEASSIGMHVRHQTDHVAALLDGLALGWVDYEARVRGTELEADRELALQTLLSLEARLCECAGRGCGVTPVALTLELRVRTQLDSESPPQELRSTWGRELAFVLSHSIHHNAIIGMLAAGLGYEVPRAFILAPSTMAYLASAECAPLA